MDSPVSEIMIPKSKIFTISTNDIVNSNLIERIIKHSFSRIPVVWADQKDLVLGFMRPEDFLSLDIGNKTVCQLIIEELIVLDLPYYEFEDAPLGQVQEAASEMRSKAVLIAQNATDLSKQTNEIMRNLAKHREDPSSFVLPE